MKGKQLTNKEWIGSYQMMTNLMYILLLKVSLILNRWRRDNLDLAKKLKIPNQ